MEKRLRVERLRERLRKVERGRWGTKEEALNRLRGLRATRKELMEKGVELGEELTGRWGVWWDEEEGVWRAGRREGGEEELRRRERELWELLEGR